MNLTFEEKYKKAIEGGDKASSITTLTQCFQSKECPAPIRESSVLKISTLLESNEELSELILSLLDASSKDPSSLLASVSRAKCARIIKLLVDEFERLPPSPLQTQTCRRLLEWSLSEKQSFLASALKTKLASFLLTNRQYGEAIEVTQEILGELKRLDDKLALVSVHLIESKIYFALQNGPKCKAALTAARSNANSVYCPPPIQGSLDLQSALVFADDGDFKSAYSYFVEALESFSASKSTEKKAITCIKYIILCKIMMGQAEEIDGWLLGKSVSSFDLGKEPIEAMKAVGLAYQKRSLAAFEAALTQHPISLGEDMMIHGHFETLYDQLLVSNLQSLILPYSRIQISWIAQSIKLDHAIVESRLALMIIEGQLGDAVIDEDCLVLESRASYDTSFASCLQTIEQLDSIVDVLKQKALQSPTIQKS